MKKNSFRKTVDEWIEKADGDEEALADAIVEFVEVADPSELDAMASYLAHELLADNDDADEEDYK